LICCGMDQCCAPDQECCDGVCCAVGATCCQDHCRVLGACCDFISGTCTENGELCCVAQNGVWLGQGSVCEPSDLCMPVCDNCHYVSGEISECFHSGVPPGSPCGPNECLRNVLQFTATCDYHPERVGDPQCDTAQHSDPKAYKIIQYRHGLPEGQTCSRILSYTPWNVSRTYFGCGKDCFPKDWPNSAQDVWNVGCVIPSCSGMQISVAPRGHAKVCGCSEP
jgi:hypothetical protein